MVKEEILVVDDQASVRESLKMIFSPPYEVYEAENGEEAIGLLQAQEGIGLVFLDLHMPGMSGFDTLKKIRKIKPGLGVIILTGYNTMANAREAIRLGVEDFIGKPFVAAELFSVVSKVMEARRFSMKIENLLERIKSLRSGGDPPETPEGGRGRGPRSG